MDERFVFRWRRAAWATVIVPDYVFGEVVEK